MNYYGKAQSAAQQVVSAFEKGAVPAALATRWLRHEDVPCSAYSVTNQLLIALHGHDDARTFMQWKNIGRHVERSGS